MNTIQLLVSLQRAWRSRRSGSRPRARPRPLVWALALAGVATHSLGPWAGEAHAAGALPTGLNVVAGQATVVQTPSQLTVTNSAGAVLNWQTFNIGAANAVRFEQPTDASKVFNRVVGSNPSQIFGKLSSNGEVWLVNPNGVLFGRDARVDVRSLVVSTLNIGNDDWRAGRFSLTGGAGNTASIVNQGELRTTTGGRVLLLAGAGGVRNEGVITAPDGQVALAAGASVDLADGQTRHVAVRVQAPQGEVLNLGSLAAGGGRVDLVAAMVNQQGFVRAESLSGSGGQIVLQGSQGVDMAAGSVTSAAGASGGQVSVDGGSGTTLLAGELRVTGSAGTGGDALLLGRQVGLLDGALADASGSTGGGRVRVGGGLQGHDTTVTNAKAVYMGTGAQVRADATRSGDGGTIVLWSDEATRAYGTLSARGGVDGGNGGFIETSGGWLDAQPASVRTDATRGQAGLWLLDPNNIQIVSQGVNTNVTPGPNFGTTNDNAIITAQSIVAALNAGNNVTITTGTGGTNLQAGDITMSNATISANPAQGVSLTMTAARNITLSNATIETVNAPMNVTLSAANGSSGTGAIEVTESRITTRGGNIVLGGNSLAIGENITSPRVGAVGVGGSESDAVGVLIQGSTLDAGAGNISITGLAIPDRNRGGAGVLISDAFDFNGETFEIIPSTLIGRDIDIYGWIDGNANSFRRGVYIIGDSQITATHGITLTGVANSAAFYSNGEGGNEPIGVAVQGATINVQPVGTDTTAFLNIDGTLNEAAATGPADGTVRTGVLISGNTVVGASGGAKVHIAGHDLSDQPGYTTAVVLESGAQLDFAAAGAVKIDGNTRVDMYSQISAPFGDTFTATAGDLLTFGGTLDGSPTAVSFIGRDILFNGSNIYIGNSLPATLTLTASRDITLQNAGVQSDGDTIMMNFTAAAGSSGSGTVRIEESYLYSGGGDITIGGGSVATGPNITAPGAGAVATDASSESAGVAIVGSQIDVSNGRLSITGRSTQSNVQETYGVLLSGGGESSTRLYGADIAIDGWVDSNGAVRRTGVYMGSDNYIFATNSLAITGVANSTVFHSGNVEPTGVWIDGFVNLYPQYFYPGGVRPRGQINEVPPPPTSGLDPAFTITGTTNDGPRTSVEEPTRYGVNITELATVIVGYYDRPAPRSTPNGGPPPQLTQVPATITGTDLSANNEVAVRMVSQNAYFDAASSLSIQGNRQVELGGYIQAPNGGPVNVHAGTTLSLLEMQMVGAPTLVDMSADSLLLASGTINFESLTAITLRAPEVRLGYGEVFDVVTLGTIGVFTDHFVTDQSATLQAESSGTAIVIAGFDRQSGIRTLESTNAPADLLTESGRSLIYAVDDSIPDQGLNFRFRQYGMTYPTEPTATGNGLVYTLAPVLTLSSQTPITKVYDGTNTVTTPNVSLQLTGLRPGQGLDTGFGTPALSYPGVNVAANQLLNVSGYTQPTISDNGDRPVYGYTTVFDVRGDITPRAVTLSGVTAAGKVYDGTRAATLSGGTLSNLVSGEALTLALSGGQFDTANVGTGKVVSGTAALQDGSGLASNYTLVGGSFTTTASITPRTLTVTGVAVAGKVYDGSAAASLSGGTLGNLVAGETLGLNFSSGLFNNANAGTGKAVTGNATLADGSGLASNYQLAGGGAVTATGDISRRSVSLSNLLANGKVYDGTLNVTVTGGSLSGLVEGEALGLSFANSQLVTAGVGTNKALNTTATLLNGNGGLASNYTLSLPEGPYNSNAAVTPATLLYLATPVSLTPSQLGRPLLGSVTGFVAGETQASATTGNLLFSTSATGSSVPGPYPINGSGLTAANYVFAQAAGNATALTLLPAPTVVVTETVGLPEIDDTQRSYRQALPPLPRGPEGTRTLDALQSMRVDATWLSMSFGELDLSSLSREEVAALLEARRQYKMSVLAVGRDKLALDPSLADVPACQTVRQSETGRCLVTAELLAAVDAGGETASIPPQAPLPSRPTPLPGEVPLPPAPQAVSPIPVGPLPLATAPTLAAAPLPAPVPAATTAPAAASPAAPAPATTVATAPATVPAPVEARTPPPRVRVAAQPVLQAPALPSARPVRNASIPQIQRKIAVLVGIDNYVDERIPSLDNARRDVDAVAGILENRLGYETVIVRDAGREAMVGVLNKLALQVRPTDSVVVYYAGHGTVIDGTGQGYWIPATADAERPETWISNRDIGRLLGGIRASQVVLISDSCFSGSLVGDKRIQASTSTDPRPLLQRRATLVMSSGGDEPVADGARNGHSPFANSLMFNLQNLDNWRPGGNVFQRVLSEVTERLPQTPRYGPARDTRFVEGGDYLFEQRELGSR